MDVELPNASGKLKERYVGPYTITKVLPHGTYELADPSDKLKTQLAKMIDGLKSLGIYDLIKANPRTSDVNDQPCSNAVFPGGLQQEGG